jgi:hypothetical protein
MLSHFLKKLVFDLQDRIVLNLNFWSFEFVSARPGATAIKLILVRVKQESLKQINFLIVIQVWARDFDIRISDFLPCLFSP